jgi:hypothetical protein
MSDALATALIDPVADAADRVSELQARIKQMQSTKLDTRALPTHPMFADLLPGDSLKSGVAYSIDGSLSLAMALMAGPSAAGSWCGVVGIPDFGTEAAAAFGIDLERLVLIPDPREHWLTVTTAVADVLTVVVITPPKRVSDGEVARLAARLRQHGSTLLVLGNWPQTEASLRITKSSWAGLGAGHGYLNGRAATVSVTGRGGISRSKEIFLGRQPSAEVPEPAIQPATRTAARTLWAV